MTAPTGAVAAVDLGATSGRVMIGRVGPGTLTLEQVARFPNGPVDGSDGLRWDFDTLYADILDGLGAAVAREPRLQSIGIDSWAVDYGLLRDGKLLAAPFHYRDDRTVRGVAAVHRIAAFAELYRRNGLQFLPFNTLYQLCADTRVADADTMLLIPDLIAHLLTGARTAERTNASTTGLMRVDTREWDVDLVTRLGIDSTILPPLVDPGTNLGLVRGLAETQIGATLDVIAVGSHDTASAVAAVPMTSPDVAFISCGTWGLVGLELRTPVVTDTARDANFTNELGVDGRIRFLHNVTGLWLLTESVRAWEEQDAAAVDLGRLLAAATEVTGEIPLFDANDASLTTPGDLPSRIAAVLRSAGQRVPESRAALVRTIVESLAAAFADAVHAAGGLAGRRIDAIHLVGGGALNRLLCQATANRSGLRVHAGPVEATALGNVLIQARTHGWLGTDATLEDLRALVARSHPPVTYAPRA